MGETVTGSYLQWLRNELEDSPFWRHMGIAFERLEPGEVIVQLPVKDELLNSNSTLHGGAIASILDAVIAATIRSRKEVRVATISLTTQFVAPIKEGTIYATANIVNPDKRIQYVESKVTDVNGNAIATALGTFAILR